jgi:hypothetical protein
MTLPSLLFAFVLASLCGVLFHVLRGGTGWRLLLFIVFSIFGFALGQVISIWRGWHLLSFGALEIGMGMIGSALFLLIGDWLSRFDGNQ